MVVRSEKRDQIVHIEFIQQTAEHLLNKYSLNLRYKKYTHRT